MNRRDAFKSIAGLSALTVLTENAVAMPTENDIAKVQESLAASPWAGSAAAGYVNRLSHADYDLLNVPAGQRIPERAYMFSQPIGSLLPGVCADCGSHRFASSDYKTLLCTNMYRANQFPPPESRAVERLIFLFSPLMLKEDRDQLISKSYWEFRLGDKIVGRAPMAWSPVEGELTDLFEFDGKMPKRIGRNEQKLSPGQYVHLAKPLYIAPIQQFSLELATPEPFIAKGDINMYCLLDGTGDFAVQ